LRVTPTPLGAWASDKLLDTKNAAATANKVFAKPEHTSNLIIMVL